MELCESLTVWDNVLIGLEGARAGANVLRQFVGKPGDAAEGETKVRWAIEACGLNDVADQQVAGLTSSRRRYVEIARCLVGPFDLLMLDEPSSGLDVAETEQFGQVLQAAVRERGVGVLLVEHDMALVMGICHDIYVMDFGARLFHGTPQEVQNSEVVQSAYLGSGEVTSTIWNVAR
jgi:ABC-type branched-subunit amino acid transport system ATPase component